MRNPIDEGAIPPQRWWPLAVAGIVLAAGTLGWAMFPSGPWETGEARLALGIRQFRPTLGEPAAPGAPATVLLARGAALLTGDSFRGAVVLSLLGWLIMTGGLLSVYRRLLNTAPVLVRHPDLVALAAGVLLAFSPAVLATASTASPVMPAAALLVLALLAVVDGPDRASPGQLVWFGVAVSLAAGCHPVLGPALLALLLAVVAQVRDSRRQLAALVAATVVTIVWVGILADAVGGLGGMLSWVTGRWGEVLAYEGAASRAGWSPGVVIARFVAHPWGPKWLAGPILLLALIGAFQVRVHRRGLHLALGAFAGTHLLLMLGMFNPAAAAREVVPALPAVALLAALGLERTLRRISAGWVPVATAGMAALALAYTWPVLALRAGTESPGAAAAREAGIRAGEAGIVAVATEVAPFAALALPGRPLPGVDAAMIEAFDRPDVPVVLMAPGTAPEAIVFQRPRSDALGKLTRDHHDAVSVRIVTPSQRFAGIRGVYGVEREPSGKREWRWLAPIAELRLAGASRVHLTLALPQLVPWPEVEVAVQVGASPPEVLTVARGDEVSLTLSAPGPDPFLLRLHSTRSFVPSEEGQGPDSRRLSVQLVNLSSDPVSGERAGEPT